MNDTRCKISAATLARTAALALALTNQVLSACGKPMLPIDPFVGGWKSFRGYSEGTER